MKKLLFVLAFAFIGQQAFSQMYMVVLSETSDMHPSGFDDPNTQYDGVMTIIDPTGNVTYTYLEAHAASYNPANLILVNQALNNIISLGYKLVGMNPQGTFNPDARPNGWDQVFFLAIP